MGGCPNKVILHLFACLACAGVFGCVKADEIHGTVEQYFSTLSGQRGISGDLRWIQLTDDIGPSWGAAAGWYQEWGEQQLDENYVSYDSRGYGARMGRFRSSFGFSTWSDQHYTPFIALPAIRSYVPVSGHLNLYRLDRGAEVSARRGALQCNVDLVDSDESDWKLLPDQANTAIGRVQYASGRAILGLNGLVKDGSNQIHEDRIADFDFRYAMPRVILRGELVSGQQYGAGSNGFYTDLMYRPVGLARTQVGVRFQGIDHIGAYWYPSYNSELYTFAARQILSKNLTLDVNYGTGGRIPADYGIRGWSTQLTASFNF